MWRLCRPLVDSTRRRCAAAAPSVVLLRQKTVVVGSDFGGVRLDRFVLSTLPDMPRSLLFRLLRTRKITFAEPAHPNIWLRADASDRVVPGTVVNLPSECDEFPVRAASERLSQMTSESGLTEKELQWARSLVLYEDDDFVVLNKPSGLPSQGGPGIRRSVAHLLPAWCGPHATDAPRLVHRLDRDTSGALLLARTRPAAVRAAALLRRAALPKMYWAAVRGRVRPAQGRIQLPLQRVGDRVVARPDRARLPGVSRSDERDAAGGADEAGQPDADGEGEDGAVGERRARQGPVRPAATEYRLVDRAGDEAAWLALYPDTGRTHQLRVHCASALQAPVLGDMLYGGGDAGALGAFLLGADRSVLRTLHLHARAVAVPSRAGWHVVTAPLPPHMQHTWRALSWTERDGDAEFERIVQRARAAPHTGPAEGIPASPPPREAGRGSGRPRRERSRSGAL